MKNAALHNLGCKVNSYELDIMQQMLVEKGYNIVPFDEIADIYIVNTCTVTNIADRKSRQMLHRAKLKNPDAVVVAVGCYVQTGKENVKLDDSIDLAIGNNRKKDLVQILEAFLAERETVAERSQVQEMEVQCHIPDKQDKTLGDTTILDIDNTYEYEEMTLQKTAEHTRAYIKVQDGCNQFCSYCAIPLARGRVRSRKAEDIIREIEGMVKTGYREIVLTGIHISSYGIDFDEEAWQQGKSVEVHRSAERRDYSGESKLIDLVERIHDIAGLERIRLGSLEPRIVTREVAQRLAALPKICPHFHLSLQSGCDEVLKRMNRHYTTGEYYESVTYLREAFEHPAITTDVIVGFPGETEEEFACTKAFLEKTDFYEMHIFKYSKRSGTRAAVMPGQLTEAVKGVRSNELLALEKEQSKAFRSFYLGQNVEVLLEELKEIAGERYWLGHTPAYVRVAVKEREGLGSNLLVKVKTDAFLTDEIMTGELVEE
ncbi:MAG: tRNA (N(6)-L-threonylcarbamoyladenosine(37)-C(2))-methylthiotransferase MtaB [Lachnospiraceae bacterium]|nr:tRNA (N(6)-L-threonylcarbamoyladenosine(37)-C(2))-methylthiotransferase MtaB [Lachnospiraceae bacterium]